MTTTNTHQPTMSPPQPQSVPELLRMLESAFNRGCGLFDDEVKRLMDAARRIEGGVEAARMLLRARFGEFGADAPRLLRRLVNRITIGLFFLFGLFILSAFMAWRLWYFEPQIQPVSPKVVEALNSLRVPYRVKIQKADIPVVGQTVKGRYAALVLDRTNEPLQGVDVTYTVNDTNTGQDQSSLVDADSEPLPNVTLSTNDAGMTPAPSLQIGQTAGKSFTLVATVRGSKNSAVTDSVIADSVTLTTALHDTRTIILLDKSGAPLTPTSTVLFDANVPLDLKFQLFDGDPNARPAQIPPASQATAPDILVELRDSTRKKIVGKSTSGGSATITHTFPAEMDGAALTLAEKDAISVNTGKPAERFTFTLKLNPPPASAPTTSPGASPSTGKASAAAAKKKADDDAAAKKKAEDDAAAKTKADDEAAKKKSTTP
jgi:hypothetical protein